MIDLSKKDLPNAVTVDGESFPIYTDFRYWIRFSELIQNINDLEFSDLTFLFVDKVPNKPFFAALQEFYESKSETPYSSNEGAQAVYYDLDGEYIWAAFMQQYNIDILETELHWHKFLALLRGLTDNTKMGEIMGYRCFKKDSRKIEEQYEHLKAIWTPKKKAKNKFETELKELFYNS